MLVKLSYEGTEKKSNKKVEYWDLYGVRYLVYQDGQLINDVRETRNS